MITEHVFVTTMEADETMRAAMAFLRGRGFEAAAAPAFAVGQTRWDGIEMRRGRTNPERAKSVSELPQTVRVEWDRGRVTIAAAITPSHAWGGTHWGNIGFGISAGATGVPKKMVLHEQLLMAITTGLEDVLVRRADAATAGAAWDLAEASIADAARRARRNRMILLVVVIVMVAALGGLIAWAIIQDR